MNTMGGYRLIPLGKRNRTDSYCLAVAGTGESSQEERKRRLEMAEIKGLWEVSMAT